MVSPRRHRQRGFTLIEILLATVLLAGGLAVAFATLRASTATVERAEQMATDSERIRAVQGFLYRRLVSAQPVAFDSDARTGDPVRFIGEAGRMRFVSDVPDYLGRGGPALHDVQIVRDRDGSRLEVAFATVLAGEVFQDSPPRPPEPLADDLGQARFAYRGLDAQGVLGGWQDSWNNGLQLPVQVRLEVTAADGRAWPPLVVALAQADGRALADGTGGALELLQ